jgi:carboxyl-terminal processing protease
MKVVRYILVGFLVIATMAIMFGSGLLIGWFNPEPGRYLVSLFKPEASLSATQSLPQDKSGDTDLQTLFVPFWQAWDLVHSEYVDQPVDDTLMMQGAISGMMDSLGDPHTSYMNPEEYDIVNTDLEGSYEGIGAWVDTTGDYLTIISPMTDSPAEEAGLQPGDQVIAVNGKDMTGVDGDVVLKDVKGPAGTDVVLTIKREGMEEPFDVTITRREIEVPSVESEMLEGNIAYIQLYTYGVTTPDELHSALETLLEDNPKGIILDLRNNGGGYLDSAIQIVSEFIDRGNVAMYEEMGDGSQKVYKTSGGGLATDIPLVVLINQGSASASEITAGAIQDLNRGTLVGEVSYGKGSVQIWTPLTNNQGAVRVTVARWLTPNERQINGVGITPDVAVEYTEDDYENNVDPQLDKAIEILSTEN